MKAKKPNYIDGFVFPIPKIHLNKYKGVAEKVAGIWKEHGAIAYFEYVGDDLKLEGTKPFPELIKAKDDEVIIFGWVVFESKESRDIANKGVASDSRMTELTAPLYNSSKIIFDAKRMAYGGFQALIQSTWRSAVPCDKHILALLVHNEI